MNGFLQTQEGEVTFKTLFENATLGMLVVDANGFIHQANPCIAAKFGFHAEELIGKPVEVLLPEAFRSAHENHRLKYFASPNPRPMGVGLKLFGRKKTGEDFPVEISLAHFQNERKSFAIAFVTDISQRTEVEEKMRSSEAKYRQLFDGLNECIHILELVKDSNGNVTDSRFVLVNQTTADLLGMKKEQLEGRLRSEVLGKMDDESVRLSHLAMQTGERINYEKFYPQLNRWLAGSFYSPDRKQVVAFVHDITHLKKMEEQLRKLNEGLELKIAEHTLELEHSLARERELNKMKSGFVALASHEFRTPLTTIQSSMSLIEAYSADENKEKRSKHIAKVKSMVKNMVDIINDFLSLDKLEEGKTDLLKQTFSLNNLCYELKDQLSGILKAGQQLRVAADAHIEINSDRKILRNVLVNLLSNAIKYSPENKPIYLSAIRNGREICLTVRDEGIGIPSNEQTNLFSNFFRGSNVGSAEGTGLGLYIVKKYVDMLGGKINFQSESGKGSMFQVVIPA